MRRLVVGAVLSRAHHSHCVVPMSHRLDHLIADIVREGL